MILIKFIYLCVCIFTIILQLSSNAKVDRWFEMLTTFSLSRPESGFISSAGIEDTFEDIPVDEDEKITEGTRSLLSKLSVRKRKKLLGLKLGNVTTF